MADDRVALWLTLFQHALEILDSAPIPEERFKHWSFGGGTALMRSYHHRFSKDIDIFVPDPQYLGYLTPRLNDVAEAKTSDYVEQAGFVKLVFAEGEIDFVVANPLTPDPYRVEEILGRPVRVETTAEIVAKKLKYRAAEFKGRDIFDVALVSNAILKCWATSAPSWSMQKLPCSTGWRETTRSCVRTLPRSTPSATPRPMTTAWLG